MTTAGDAMWKYWTTIVGLTVVGCNPQDDWRGCELSSQCAWDETCEVDVDARVGVCVKDEDTTDTGGGGGGGGSNGRCTTGAEDAGSTVRAVPAEGGGTAFSFSFEQTRLTEPQPCDNDLKLYLSITNRLATTESFEYQVDIVANNGQSYGSTKNTVFDLAPGATTEEGVILEAQVNIQNLDFVVTTEPR